MGYIKRLSAISLVCVVLLGVIGCLITKNSREDTVNVPTVFVYNNAEVLVPDYMEIEELFITKLFGDKGDSYEVYDASELTFKILKNRKGTTIVERCIGVVTNKNTGDGKILNAYNKNYDYISYRSVTDQKYCDGTILMSYMVYNPDTNYFDDVIERYDFVICRDYEKDFI